MKKTTILFDLDNTLIDRLEAAKKTYYTFINETFIGADETFRDEVFAELFELDRNGTTPKEEVFFPIEQKYNLEEGWALNKIERWSSELAGNTITFPGTKETLEKLKPYYKLGIISNGSVQAQSMKLEISGIKPLFEMVLFTGEIGIYKPDPRVFLEGCRRIGCQPDEAYYVGDNIPFDIEGSRNVGMAPIFIWRDDSFSVEGVPRIYCIEELLGIISI